MPYFDETDFEPVPEFLEKINELVNDAVVAGREEMVKEMSEIRRSNANLRKTNGELSAQVRDVRRETEKQIEAARKEFEREMFGGFLRGDPMFYAGFEYESTPCETCKGSGVLWATLSIGGAEVEIPCTGNGCKGGKIQQGLYVAKESIVTSMYLEVGGYGRRVIRIYFKKSNSYDDSNLLVAECYKSKEQAQVRCDELTAKRRKEDAERMAKR